MRINAYILPILMVFLVCAAMYGFGCEKINPDNAIDAIVGEAANQDYDTMLCVAQAIRHRGTLFGVYGLHAKHNQTESEDTWELAEQAWEDSSVERDRIQGTRNFGTWDDLQRLRVKMYKVRCGDFYFY